MLTIQSIERGGLVVQDIKKLRDTRYAPGDCVLLLYFRDGLSDNARDKCWRNDPEVGRITQRDSGDDRWFRISGPPAQRG